MNMLRGKVLVTTVLVAMLVGAIGVGVARADFATGRTGGKSDGTTPRPGMTTYAGEPDASSHGPMPNNKSTSGLGSGTSATWLVQLWYRWWLNSHPSAPQHPGGHGSRP